MVVDAFFITASMVQTWSITSISLRSICCVKSGEIVCQSSPRLLDLNNLFAAKYKVDASCEETIKGASQFQRYAGSPFPDIG